MSLAQVICGPRDTFQYVAVQKVWDADRRKRVSAMTVHSYFLHGLPYLHVPVISKSFIFHSKKKKDIESTLDLLNNTQNSELSPSQGIKNFSGTTEVYPIGKRYMRRMLFSTSCCHVPYLHLSNTCWKHLSEQMQYHESFEVRVHSYEENEFCRNLASVGTDPY